jgi:hypothetical protein
MRTLPGEREHSGGCCADARRHKQSGYPLDGDLSDWIAYLSEESYDPITSKWLEFVADPEAHTLTVNGQWLTGTWSE